MQSSDTFEVFQTTEVGDLRLQPETTEPECQAETTTTPAPDDCVEDASEVEATIKEDKSKAKASEKAAEGKTEKLNTQISLRAKGLTRTGNEYNIIFVLVQSINNFPIEEEISS